MPPEANIPGWQLENPPSRKRPSRGAAEDEEVARPTASPADSEQPVPGGEPATAAEPPPTAVFSPVAPPPPPAAEMPAEPTPPAPPEWPSRVGANAVLAVAAISLAGGIFGLLVAKQAGFTKISLCCAATFVALGGIAVLLRWVSGTEEVRSALALVASLFAAACWVFADDLSNPTMHDNLVKASIAAGILTVVALVGALILPSPVVGVLSLLSLAAGVDLSVYLSLNVPTAFELTVAIAGLGLFVALVGPRLVGLTRIPLVRAHPRARGYIVGGAAIFLVGPELGNMAATNDAFAIAAASCGGLALLLLGQRFRNLAIAIGAFLVVATLVGVLLAREVRPGPGSTASSSDVATAATASLIVIGFGLCVVVGVVTALSVRHVVPRWPLPVRVEELLLVASFVLALIALTTVPSNDISTPLVPNGTLQQQQTQPFPLPINPASPTS